jgi:hypothetical protein
MKSASRSQNDRRAIAALFAVFALLVQALIPSAAMAAQRDDSAAQIICTGDSVHLLTAGGKAPAPHKGIAGMPCQDCLAVSIAAVITAPIAVEPVAYAIARVEHAPIRPVLAPRARAPPRPPGQGPPTA